MSVNSLNITTRLLPQVLQSCHKQDGVEVWDNPVNIGEEINQESACSLCNQSYTEDNAPQSLLCGHAYHKDCFKDHLSDKISDHFKKRKSLPRKLYCPTCNVSIFRSNQVADNQAKTLFQELCGKVEYVKSSIFHGITQIKYHLLELGNQLKTAFALSSTGNGQVVLMMPIFTYEISLVAQLAFSEISRELFIGQFAGLLVLITAAIAIPIIGEIIRIDEGDDLSNRLSKYTFSSIPVRAVGSGAALWAATVYMGLSISAVTVIASTVATVFAGIALLEIARAARTALNI